MVGVGWELVGSWEEHDKEIVLIMWQLTANLHHTKQETNHLALFLGRKAVDFRGADTDM